MALWVPAAIGFGILGAALSRGKKKHCKEHQHGPSFRGTHSRGPVDCEPFPWLPDEVDVVLVATWEDGVRDAWQLAMVALKEVYSETPDGRPMNWPTITMDCPEARLLEHRVKLRANRVCSLLDDELANDEWYESGGY